MNINYIIYYNAINAFLTKLWLRIGRIQKENVAYFPKLNIAIEKNLITGERLIKGVLKVEVEDHVQLFKKIQIRLRRFERSKDIFFKDLQKEFSEIQCNSNANKNFEVLSLTDFWPKYMWVKYAHIQKCGYFTLNNDYCSFLI